MRFKLIRSHSQTRLRLVVRQVVLSSPVSTYLEVKALNADIRSFVFISCGKSYNSIT